MLIEEFNRLILNFILWNKSYLENGQNISDNTPTDF